VADVSEVLTASMLVIFGFVSFTTVCGKNEYEKIFPATCGRDANVRLLYSTFLLHRPPPDGSACSLSTSFF
jgi:hypothetical protein